MWRTAFGLALAVALAFSAAADDQSVCANTASPPELAIAACSRTISSSKSRDQALAIAYRQRAYFYATRQEYDRATADLSEGIRVEAESKPSQIQAFLSANSSLIIGFGTLLVACIGWYFTYRGWSVVHNNNSALEQDKYRNAVDLEKRKAELQYVSDQIRYLYGPLTALCATRRAAFDAMMEKLAPKRTSFFDGRKRTPEELQQWRLWRTEVLMPLIVKMEEAILQNSHLIDGAEMPASSTALLSHVAAYKAVLKHWADIAERDKANNTKEIDNLSDDRYASVINFPEEFAREVSSTFRRLKARQAELIARVQTSS
jgi:hypothetical protein